MIACDVVLLPPREIMEKIIEMNRKLVEAGNDDIVLDVKKRVPHITLAMGCLEEDDMQKVGGILSDIANSFLPISLRTVSFEGGIASLRIEKNRDIELLHEVVMIRLSSLFNYKVTDDMVYKDHAEELSDVTFEYIRKFPTASSFENYTPHITVGRGEMDMTVAPFGFVSRKLALCHLGNFCTCRKILVSHGI